MAIIKTDIDGGKSFDFGRTSDDYAKYRDIYPDVFYKKITDMGLCVEGQRVLDLGTGTGVLPRNLYKYGAEFVGADISDNQIKQARKLSAKANVDIEYIVSSAEAVDFPDRSFDVITACQCFIYFDKAVIGQKLYSLLKDGGHFCKLSMIWLPEESEIAKASENLVLKHNPTWTGAGFTRESCATYGLELPECLAEFFEISNAVSYDVPLTFTRESWHGRMKACRGIGASSLSAEEIVEWEREHITYLQNVPAKFEIPHFIAMLNMKRK
jgi:SAM-dependent methyltransferase